PSSTPSAAPTPAPPSFPTRRSSDLSYPLPHEDRFICYVLNTLLGGGMSSRLFQNIRERMGLAYAVYSEISMYSDTGCFAIYAGTDRKSTRLNSSHVAISYAGFCLKK